MIIPIEANVRAVNGFILARYVGKDEKTPGGLVLPDTAVAENEKNLWKVVSSSVDWINPGDIVLLSKKALNSIYTTPVRQFDAGVQMCFKSEEVCCVITGLDDGRN